MWHFQEMVVLKFFLSCVDFAFLPIHLSEIDYSQENKTVQYYLYK